MTLSTTSNKAVLQGNGSATSFSFGFPIPLASYLVVTYTDASGARTVLDSSVYSVTGIGSSSGGAVTYPLTGSPIASGTSITIERIVPVTQLVTLGDQGSYSPKVVEGALDLLTMEVQQFAQPVGHNTLNARSSNTILGAADFGIALAVTGTFSQTYAASATLGSGWACDYRNEGTGIITHTPNGAETINGFSTLAMYPGETWRVYSDGSNLRAFFVSQGPVKIAVNTGSALTYDFAGLTGFAYYRFRLQDVKTASGAGDSLCVRVSESGSWMSGASAYYYSGIATPADGTGNPLQISGNGTLGKVSSGVGTNYPLDGEVTTSDLSGAIAQKSLQAKVSAGTNASLANLYSYSGSCHYVADNNAIDGVRFLWSSSDNFASSSSITCYGYRQ